MNDDEFQRSGERAAEGERDRERGARGPAQAWRRWPPGWTETTRAGRRTITRVCSYVEPEPDSVWVVEHDPDQGVFHLTGPDGNKVVFRAKPVPLLVAEPNPATGEMEPVIAPGSATRPRILLLCQEEREMGVSC